MQEIAAVAQRATPLHSYVAGDLLHPRLVRLNGDPGDVYAAALKTDEKQHVVGDQPAQREHLRGEEVRPRQQRQVGPDEGRPGCQALALWGRRQTAAPQDITDHYIRDSALGELQLAEQETISAHIIKALGSPRGLTLAVHRLR